MIEIPSAIRICDVCGDIAAGEGCATCRHIDFDACKFAAHMIAMGAFTMEFTPEPNETPAQSLFRLRVEFHFQRMRAAFDAPREEEIAVHECDQEICTHTFTDTGAAEAPDAVAGESAGAEILDETKRGALAAVRELVGAVRDVATVGLAIYVAWQFAPYFLDCIRLWSSWFRR